MHTVITHKDLQQQINNLQSVLFELFDDATPYLGAADRFVVVSRPKAEAIRNLTAKIGETVRCQQI
jgi:hypothetical protein